MGLPINWVTAKPIRLTLKWNEALFRWLTSERISEIAHYSGLILDTCHLPRDRRQMTYRYHEYTRRGPWPHIWSAQGYQFTRVCAEGGDGVRQSVTRCVCVCVLQQPWCISVTGCLSSLVSANLETDRKGGWL